RRSMEALLAREPLAGRVLLTGKLAAAEVAAWMAAADVFCLPSHSEGCPNVVLEAISCGCPVVATRGGGAPGIVGAEGGILVPPERPDELAAALRAVLAKPWDRAAIAHSSARSWDEVAEETHEVCETVLERRSARRSGEAAGRMKITVVT